MLAIVHSPPDKSGSESTHAANPNDQHWLVFAEPIIARYAIASGLAETSEERLIYVQAFR